jgi:hypothetical protein
MSSLVSFCPCGVSGNDEILAISVIKTDQKGGKAYKKRLPFPLPDEVLKESESSAAAVGFVLSAAMRTAAVDARRRHVSQSVTADLS